MKDHEVALWAGIYTFFGSLVTIGILDIFNPNDWVKVIGAVILALITGASVYAKQRYEEAKTKNEEFGSSK